MTIQNFDLFFKRKIWNLGVLITHVLLLLYCIPCKCHFFFFITLENKLYALPFLKYSDNLKFKTVCLRKNPFLVTFLQ